MKDLGKLGFGTPGNSLAPFQDRLLDLLISLFLKVLRPLHRLQLVIHLEPLSFSACNLFWILYIELCIQYTIYPEQKTLSRTDLEFFPRTLEKSGSRNSNPRGRFLSTDYPLLA